MPLSLADFAQRVPKPPDWIVPNFLTRMNTAFMIGQPKKACKSWLLLALAWDLSEGKAIWGLPELLPMRPMRTVYFTQEDTEDDIDLRIKAHLGAKREPNDRLWVVPKDLTIKLDTNEGRRIVERELDEVANTFLPTDEDGKPPKAKVGAIDLVIFDPMRRIHCGNENDSETIGEMWNVIDKIHRRYGCGVVISHHITKPPREREGYDPTDAFNGRGSGDIYGGGDAFAVVVPEGAGANGEWRRVGVHFESKRAQQMPPAHLQVTFGTGRVGSVTLPVSSLLERDTHIHSKRLEVDGVDLR